ncbi:spermidine synthase [Altererythrobacter confluentis]|uniref:Spermidine synthase n=1 Tax=Allopontixanthobacter confluentis TaxID=1849021 RepID=A0A6L7GIE5_9SPHN|nr:spermidine synthase [Allopontixanthobacter confluentis]MXP14688.1 spermidine synthase [Allopontixanthobacter confluentis]
MIARELLGTAQVPGGEELKLFSHGRDFIIGLGRNELMSTRMQFSEEQLADLTIDRLTNSAPQVLIGGYGMGFTLRATLERIGKKGHATVVELVPEIIEWARGPMAELTGDCLDDPRVTLRMGDVGDAIEQTAEGGAPFDAILLDVDNGPDGLVREDNNRLYSREGLRFARRALVKDGVLAIWSAAPDHKFTRKMESCGFDVEVREVRARPNNKGPRHTIWFARPR